MRKDGRIFEAHGSAALQVAAHHQRNLRQLLQLVDHGRGFHRIGTLHQLALHHVHQNQTADVLCSHQPGQIAPLLRVLFQSLAREWHHD